jgi:predicted O-methyltransferase YrrM
LVPFSSELDLLPSFDQVTAEGYGLGYGEVEAHFLHCVVRHLKPHRMIEVGCGVSTYFSLNALEMNSRYGGTPATMICIEPYPSPKLRELVVQKKVNLHEKQVQDVDLRHFEELEEGDILFIDSSHAGKVDSDVYFLLFRVLPRLKKGVVIHVHDIGFPYLTCPPTHPMFNHFLFWNEAALLKAFLMWTRLLKSRSAKAICTTIPRNRSGKLHISTTDASTFPHRYG